MRESSPSQQHLPRLDNIVSIRPRGHTRCAGTNQLPLHYPCARTTGFCALEAGLRTLPTVYDQSPYPGIRAAPRWLQSRKYPRSAGHRQRQTQPPDRQRSLLSSVPRSRKSAPLLYPTTARHPLENIPAPGGALPPDRATRLVRWKCYRSKPIQFSFGKLPPKGGSLSKHRIELFLVDEVFQHAGELHRENILGGWAHAHRFQGLKILQRHGLLIHRLGN